MNQSQLNNLRFCANHNNIDIYQLSNYTLTTWPPAGVIIFFNKDGTGPSINNKGESQGFFEDDYWNAKFYGHVGFNFKKQNISDQNKKILKQLICLYLWYEPIYPGKIASVYSYFPALCSYARYADKFNIRIDQFYRFPRLYEGLISSLTPSAQEKLITCLSTFYHHRDEIGLTLANKDFLSELKRLKIPFKPNQHPYIPPRIWMNMINRCDEILEKYLSNRFDFEAGISELIEAYKHNQSVNPSRPSPFSKFVSHNHNDFIFLNHDDFLSTYKIRDLIDYLGISYVNCDGNELTLKAITSILNIIQSVSFWYVIAHSIQRKSEAKSLRFDCFLEDKDMTLGTVSMLKGESTKTDPDSDARWIVPSNVKKAIDCLKSISKLKHLSTGKPPTDSSPLFTTYRPAWSPNNSFNEGDGLYNKLSSVVGDTLNNKKIFPDTLFSITAEDYATAYQLTPKLTEKDWFKVGGVWHFTAHQFRRTLAVNLFSSGLPSDVIQWLMKHKTIAQSFYYGRNYHRLFVNEEAKNFVVNESHITKLNKFTELAMGSSEDDVFPVGRNMTESKVLNLVENKTFNKITKMIKNGLLDARPTLLGLCMAPSCSYGGIESAAHCAGTNGKGPCKDAIFSKKKLPRLKKLLQSHRKALETLDTQTAEYFALTHEIEAIEVYLNATSSNS